MIPGRKLNRVNYVGTVDKPQLSLLLNKHHRIEALSAPLKDYTKSSRPQRFTKAISSPEREKASKGIIPGNTEASSQ